MFDQSAGAIDCRAFFVASNDEADRSGIGWNFVQRCDKRRDAALHIDRPAPMQQVTAHFRYERASDPAFSRGNNIKMSGKSEMAAAALADGEQIFGWTAVCGVGVAFASHEPLNDKPKRDQHCLKRIKNRAAGGCNAFAGDQGLGVGERGIIHAFAGMTTRLGFVYN